MLRTPTSRLYSPNANSKYDPRASTNPLVSAAIYSPRTATTSLFPRSSCGISPYIISIRGFSWPPLPSQFFTPLVLPLPDDQVSGKEVAGSLHSMFHYPPLPPREIIIWYGIRPSRLLDQILKRSFLWWGITAVLGITVRPIIWLRLLTLLPKPGVFWNLVSLWIEKDLSVMNLRRLMTENISIEAGRVCQRATLPFWYKTINPSIVSWIFSTWGSTAFKYLWNMHTSWRTPRRSIFLYVY